MAEKPRKIPDASHPIAIEPSPSRIRVTVGGRIVADSSEALSLREASYPPVDYIPRKDVDMSQLQRTEHHSYCPYKGDCSYYSIPAGGEQLVNAVWTYEQPYPAVAQIAGYLAFYPNRAEIERLSK